MKELKWLNEQIPHKIYLADIQGHTHITMHIVKDLQPEVLSLTIDIPLEEVEKAWEGCAVSLSEEYNDENLYSQVRALFNLKSGCVVWFVNHIKLPSGKKTSYDRLAWVPNMKSSEQKLVAI